MAKLQKRFKHKTKFSKNWQKLKAKISKLHHKIANIRKNYLHQISSSISKNHAIVYVEDLQVANMSKSAKGNAEQHGKNVKQKSGLNRAILDQSWYEFRRQLEYKAVQRGGQVVVADRWYPSSKTCSSCGHKLEVLSLSIRQWTCPSCGTHHDRDINAAVNLKNMAVSSTVSVCGEEGAGLGRKTRVKPASVKQKVSFTTV